jgi:predicted site-specific integrase-resolvase
VRAFERHCTKRHPSELPDSALKTGTPRRLGFCTFPVTFVYNSWQVLYNTKYMRIALYARVSTKDKGQDTENQLLQLRQYAKQQGWTIFREYTDERSGRTADRAEFQRLFQDAYEKRFDLCLFWALDRFSRQGATDTLQHLRKLTSYGVSGNRSRSSSSTPLVCLVK